MAAKAHLEILAQGVEVWNRWRTYSDGKLPDLRDANLTSAYLERADLSFTDLSGADLTNTNLVAANFLHAKLHRTNLTDAKPVYARFIRTNLDEADFTRSSILDAIFKNSSLARTTFTRAQVGSTTFAAVDLSQTRGLDTLHHWGPSTVGTDTLYCSKGQIPQAFLKGCGLPDQIIQLAHSLILNPIEFSSCFISYSSNDQEFADRLYNDLQAKGVRCWFAPHDIKGGQKLYAQIDRAIHMHDRVLLILSPASIKSSWVKTEIAKARAREISEKRHVLFPIRLVNFDALRTWEYFDTDSGTDHAKAIRDYFIPDFRNWKDFDSYQNALSKLLQDLRGELPGDRLHTTATPGAAFR